MTTPRFQGPAEEACSGSEPAFPERPGVYNMFIPPKMLSGIMWVEEKMF